MADDMRSLPVVLVPGLLCTARLYAGVLPALARSGPVTVAETRRDDGLPAMARRLLAQVEGPFALAGLSMGGYVALEVVRQAPGRVAALALLSTTARPDAPERSAARREEIAATRAGRFAEVVDGLFGRMVAAERGADERLRATWRAMGAEVGPDAFVRQQHAIMARPDSRPLLPAIACPALVVHGAGDLLIDAAQGEELAAGIPGAELALLDCGHLTTLERPEEVAAALARLLRRAAPAG